jgi:hypothetical protein
LKHTQKHEKGREESNQEAKLTGSGGPSGQEERTVRTGLADCPACYRGPSAPTLWTVRPYAADRPLNHTEPTEATHEPRTVRGEHMTPHMGTPHTYIATKSTHFMEQVHYSFVYIQLLLQANPTG